MTLEDTLLGYLADGLRWCGEPGSSGEIWGRVGWPWGSAGHRSLVLCECSLGRWKTAFCRPVHVFQEKKNDFRIWDCPSFLILSFLREGVACFGMVGGLLSLRASFRTKEFLGRRSLQENQAEVLDLQNSPQGPHAGLLCLGLCAALPEMRGPFISQKDRKHLLVGRYFCRESLTVL